MKILLITWGTIGDVLPFAALAKDLRSAGHLVTVFTSEIYENLFKTIGVDFRSVGIPFDKGRFDQIMDRIIATRNPFKATMIVAEEGILFGAEKWFDDCRSAITDFDLAVIHSADIPGQEAVIQKNLPFITVSYCPGFIRSAFDPPAPLPDLGKNFNRFFWSIVAAMMRTQADPIFNHFITSIGGRKRKLIGIDGMYSPKLNLIASSPSITPPRRDHPKNHVITGAWFFNGHEQKINDRLTNFLENGESPIVVSFGSMSGTDPKSTTKILIDAIRAVKKRAIIQSGWGDLGRDLNESDQILITDYIPHDRLFPNASCVVHHGGAGTAHAVCRAGVPSVIVPHLADQPFWASRLRRLGVAPKPIHRKDLTSRKLADRIREAIKSPEMTENAKALSKKTRSENGLKCAIEWIEKFFALLTSNH